jgi:hypothetical protein
VSLLERYPFWKYAEFSSLIHYPIPPTLPQKRLDMVKLYEQDWTEKRIGQLLGCSRNTVMKRLRRAKQASQMNQNNDDWLFDISRAPHHKTHKVFFGAIHAVLELQKKETWRIGLF